MRTPPSKRSSRRRPASLYRRAAERYFSGAFLHSFALSTFDSVFFSCGRRTTAHNLQPEDEHTVDVHRLKPTEAIRRTEIATRDVLVAGATRLRVICGLGTIRRVGFLC